MEYGFDVVDGGNSISLSKLLLRVGIIKPFGNFLTNRSCRRNYEKIERKCVSSRNHTPDNFDSHAIVNLPNFDITKEIEAFCAQLSTPTIISNNFKSKALLFFLVEISSTIRMSKL